MWRTPWRLTALIAALASSGATAMKPVRVTNGKCTIVGSAALPELPGGSDSICRTIAAAIRAQAPSVHYSVEVTVVSASRLSADLIVEGKKLPQQRFAVMD